MFNETPNNKVNKVGRKEIKKKPAVLFLELTVREGLVRDL